MPYTKDSCNCSYKISRNYAFCIFVLAYQKKKQTRNSSVFNNFLGTFYDAAII